MIGVRLPKIFAKTGLNMGVIIGERAQSQDFEDVGRAKASRASTMMNERMNEKEVPD